MNVYFRLECGFLNIYFFNLQQRGCRSLNARRASIKRFPNSFDYMRDTFPVVAASWFGLFVLLLAQEKRRCDSKTSVLVDWKRFGNN